MTTIEMATVVATVASVSVAATPLDQQKFTLHLELAGQEAQKSHGLCRGTEPDDGASGVTSARAPGQAAAGA